MSKHDGTRLQSRGLLERPECWMRLHRVWRTGLGSRLSQLADTVRARYGFGLHGWTGRLLHLLPLRFASAPGRLLQPLLPPPNAASAAERSSPFGVVHDVRLSLSLLLRQSLFPAATDAVARAERSTSPPQPTAHSAFPIRYAVHLGDGHPGAEAMTPALPVISRLDHASPFSASRAGILLRTAIQHTIVRLDHAPALSASLPARLQPVSRVENHPSDPLPQPVAPGLPQRIADVVTTNRLHLPSRTPGTESSKRLDADSLDADSLELGGDRAHRGHSAAKQAPRIATSPDEMSTGSANSSARIESAAAAEPKASAETAIMQHRRVRRVHRETVHASQTTVITPRIQQVPARLRRLGAASTSLTPPPSRLTATSGASETPTPETPRTIQSPVLTRLDRSLPPAAPPYRLPESSRDATRRREHLSSSDDDPGGVEPEGIGPHAELPSLQHSSRRNAPFAQTVGVTRERESSPESLQSAVASHNRVARRAFAAYGDDRAQREDALALVHPLPTQEETFHSTAEETSRDVHRPRSARDASAVDVTVLDQPGARGGETSLIHPWQPTQRMLARRYDGSTITGTAPGDQAPLGSLLVPRPLARGGIGLAGTSGQAPLGSLRVPSPLARGGVSLAGTSLPSLTVAAGRRETSWTAGPELKLAPPAHAVATARPETPPEESGSTGLPRPPVAKPHGSPSGDRAVRSQAEVRALADEVYSMIVDRVRRERTARGW